MKVKNIEVLIDKCKSVEEIEEIKNHVVQSIENMQHPMGSGGFSLFAGKKANGVKPIKDSYMMHQQAHGWILEYRLDVGVTNSRPGPIDAVLPVRDKYFAVEWETGNIASSHRAINKMIVGMLNNKLIGGILILPSREMYDYLTDRVGNFRELSPYFDTWKKANYDMEEGYLAVVEIEHDSLTADESYQIKKGTDGRALR